MCDPKPPQPDMRDWAEIKFKERAESSMKTETYHSSTHGYIKLSFTGRRLLANLRDAIKGAINGQDYSFNDQAVAKARGDLASYIHELEDKQVNPVPKPLVEEFSTESLKQELARRGEYLKSLKHFTTARLYEELGLRMGI